MAEDKENKSSLRGYTEKKPAISVWIGKHMPFLLDWKSTFYFVCFVVLLGIAWAFWMLYSNSFTMLMGWDYSWQFVPFAYDYWDQWHLFFRTGQFPLYDAQIFLGTDNIGSNSYYGLFDPFVVGMAFFPRNWIPQMFAVMAITKITVSVFFMRGYLKYLGISEWPARLGALALGFSGYMNFMVGFPNVVSAIVYVPLILWGIERVIKERKVGLLVLGLFLEGITSFFFLVVLCIWGVIYALWRFLWTIKSRSKKENLEVMGLGVAAFAIGLCMSAWTILPSLRESSLSGRTSSIGTAYLHSIINSLKSRDFASFFGLIFEEVGDEPSRELMGLVSFFYPSGGYLKLPLVQTGGYDAWTAAIFCYTPFVILFFTGIIHSIRLRRFDHLLAILACLYLVFTNFAYFFFYAFSGNGYGRWFLVLVPAIIYYGCWAFERSKESSRWYSVAGSGLALLGTIIAFFAVYWLIEGKTWSNVHGLTYWQGSVRLPHEVTGSGNAIWYVYFQIIFIIAEGIVFFAGHAKEWCPQVLTAFLALEIIVAGNASAGNYISIFSYEKSFFGGPEHYQTQLRMANAINANDSSFFRTYFDRNLGSGLEEKDFQSGLHLNAASSFHSLMNFDVEDFALMNQMKAHGSYGTTYGDEQYFNPSWSGYYANKRHATDTVLGYRYYISKNDYSSWVDWASQNVPFGATEMESYSANRKIYRVYRISEEWVPSLGYAVDNNLLYHLGKSKESAYATSFYDGSTGVSGLWDLEKAQYVYSNGAIFEDDATLPDDFLVQQAPSIASDAELESFTGLKRLRDGKGLTGKIYTTTHGNYLFPAEHHHSTDDIAYFLEDGQSVITTNFDNGIKRDTGHVVFTSSTGEYLSDDPNGCYIELTYWNSDLRPRVFVLGDTFDEDGNLLKKNQLLAFEYCAFNQAFRSDSRYYSGASSTFGIYAKGGKAKYLCFLFPGPDNDAAVKFFPSRLSAYIHDYSALEAEAKKRSQSALVNVKKDVNQFTFETHYSPVDYPKGRFVVTSLGYDKGWQCEGVVNGVKKSLPVYKLNGGLVGFYAPCGDVTYTLSYCTPYLKEGVGLAAAGVGGLFAIATGSFLLALKKKKREEEPVSEGAAQ